MSGIVLEKEHVKGLLFHTVTHPSYLSMLASYRRLLLSAYGPKGNLLLISNAVGREALTSSSSEIIRELSFAHPTTKYINALISAQNSSCGLYGLYTGLVCVRLLEEALRCEDDLPYPIISDISEWIMSQLMEQLDKCPPQIVMDLDIAVMDQVVSFVKTIIRAKSCLSSTESDIDDLCINIVRAFLKSVPSEYSCSGFGHVSIATQEESKSLSGGVFEGVLYRNPDVPKAKVENVGRLGKVRVLLFVVALSFSEKTTTVCWEGPGSKEDNFFSLILKNLLSVIKERNIHIIANQKPVHPVIKFELERNGCLVLERLGTNTTEALMKVSGCLAVSTLSNLVSELNNIILGTLTSVRNVVFNNKDYILLDNCEGCVATLLLPATCPATEYSLKEIAESCLAALRMAVIDGKVVCGGGCLEAWIAATVTRLVTTDSDLSTPRPSVSPTHILKVGNIFVRVFMEMAVHLGAVSSDKFDWSLDTVFHHLWHTPPLVLGGGSSIGASAGPSSKHCVCGLLTHDTVKSKHNGGWKPVEFHISDYLSTFPTQQKKHDNHKSGKCMLRTMYHYEQGGIKPEEDDSLEGSANENENDIDSLEGSPCSFEDEIDSLEGRLESFDEEYDSLEDILDKNIQPEYCAVKETPEAKLEEYKSGALYDNFSAKFNATRLAFEGFMQLLQIGQCIFDK